MAAGSVGGVGAGEVADGGGERWGDWDGVRCLSAVMGCGLVSRAEEGDGVPIPGSRGTRGCAALLCVSLPRPDNLSHDGHKDPLPESAAELESLPGRLLHFSHRFPVVKVFLPYRVLSFFRQYPVVGRALRNHHDGESSVLKTGKSPIGKGTSTDSSPKKSRALPDKTRDAPVLYRSPSSTRSHPPTPFVARV